MPKKFTVGRFRMSNWDSAAEVYESSVANVTEPPAKELIALVHARSPFTDPNVKVLDNGAGTGALTSIIHEHYPNIQILAVDLSAGMLETLNKKNLQNVETKDVNGMDLAAGGLKDESFTHVLSTFMNQFAPSPQKTVEEMHRVLKPHGVLGLATWGKIDFERPWQDAVRQVIDPKWESPGAFEPWPQETEGVQQAIEQAGFKDVEVKRTKSVYKYKTHEELSKFVFEGGNPGVEKFISPLREHEKYGEAQKVWEEIMRKEFPDAAKIGLEAFLTVGTK